MPLLVVCFGEERESVWESVQNSSWILTSRAREVASFHFASKCSSNVATRAHRQRRVSSNILGNRCRVSASVGFRMLTKFWQVLIRPLLFRLFQCWIRLNRFDFVCFVSIFCACFRFFVFDCSTTSMSESSSSSITMIYDGWRWISSSSFSQPFTSLRACLSPKSSKFKRKASKQENEVSVTRTYSSTFNHLDWIVLVGEWVSEWARVR